MVRRVRFDFGGKNEATVSRKAGLLTHDAEISEWDVNEIGILPAGHVALLEATLEFAFHLIDGTFSLDANE